MLRQPPFYVWIDTIGVWSVPGLLLAWRHASQTENNLRIALALYGESAC
jgi:hypothetical protein